MKGLKEHQTSIRNDGFSNDGNAPLPLVVGPHTTPTDPYEEIDSGRHTYEALSERDRDTSYQKIVKPPTSHRVKPKSVSLLLLMTYWVLLSYDNKYILDIIVMTVLIAITRSLDHCNHPNQHVAFMFIITN